MTFLEGISGVFFQKKGLSTPLEMTLDFKKRSIPLEVT